jgi:hypothetical protein
LSLPFAFAARGHPLSIPPSTPPENTTKTSPACLIVAFMSPE